MALFNTARIKKTDLADFFQKAGMLVGAGYDICSACELLAKPPRRRRDHSADGIRKVAELLLPDLREGFSLHDAMETHKRIFEQYLKQIQVGEESGRLSDVLNRLYSQIKDASKIAAKLKGAMTYPVIVLLATFAAAGYMFATVIPQMLHMLSDVGVAQVPRMTQIIMNIGDWFKANAVVLAFFACAIFIVLFFYSKTIGRHAAAKFAANVPLIGKVVEDNSVATFLRNWQQMLFAGAEMSIALQTAADSVANLHIRRQFINAWSAYTSEGVPVYETLEQVDALQAMELQTIQVAIETGNITETLGILADDREFEANRSINRLTATVNPLLIGIVGIVVFVLVMAIYEPIISVTSAIT